MGQRHQPWRRRAGRALAASVGAALALLLAACDTSEGVTCCVCQCCNLEATIERADQPWSDCETPCSSFCKSDLACSGPLQRADECTE